MIITYPAGILETNCYLLVVGSQAVVIDPADDVTRFLHKETTAKGVTLTAALYTHGHIDHVSGLPSVKKNFPGIPHYLYEADAELIDNISQQAAFLGLTDTAPVRRADFTLFNNADALPLPSYIKAVHTPGHSPGGVSYITDDAVFCGDLLFCEGVGRTDLFGGDFQALTDSIQKRIFTLKDSTTVYPGHGPSSSVGHEKRHNPFVRP